MATLTRSLLVRQLHGHDGSHHQFDAGPVDLLALRRACWWLAWKATQKLKYVDPTFATIRRSAQTFDQFFAYHWLTPGVDADPEEQAAHYLRTIGELRDGEGVMLDAEERGITVSDCLRWLEAVESQTRRPASVYTGLYVASGALWRSSAIRESRYGLRPMHLAAYVSENDLWSRLTQLGVTGLPIHAWQYSSNGPVPGITGRADMNVILDPEVMHRACWPARKPQPQPDPVQPPAPDPAPTQPEEEDDVLKLIVYVKDDPQRGHALVCIDGGGTEMIGFSSPADRDGMIDRVGVQPLQVSAAQYDDFIAHALARR